MSNENTRMDLAKIAQEVGLADSAPIRMFAARLLEEAAKLAETLNHGAFGSHSYLSGVEAGSRGCANAIRVAAVEVGGCMSVIDPEGE